MVKYTPRGDRDLREITDEIARKRIRAKLVELDRDPNGSHDVKKLQGVEERWRLRLGSYRAIFTYDRKTHDIIVLHVSNRKDAY